MARRRFYAPPENISASLITLSENETHHLMHVLRMTPGQEAFVFDGCGREFRCTFSRLDGSQAQLEIQAALSDVVESPLEIILVQALAKREKFDFVIQKATELGVTSIVPLVTRYSDVRLDDQQKGERVERWRRISLEAAKQCGRRTLVEITTPCTLREFVAELKNAEKIPGVASKPDKTLLFSEKGGVPIADAVVAFPPNGRISALVGPEGGWSDDEVDSLKDCGCEPITLGPRVLRTETAALVAITLIQHWIGDLSHSNVSSGN